MSIPDLLERQDRIDDRLELPALEAWQDPLTKPGGHLALLLDAPAPHDTADDAKALAENRSEISLRASPADQAEEHQAAPDTQAGDIPVPIARADQIEYEIDPRSAGQLADGFDAADLSLGQEMELVLGTLYEDDEHEYVMWKWRPAEGVGATG